MTVEEILHELRTILKEHARENGRNGKDYYKPVVCQSINLKLDDHTFDLVNKYAYEKNMAIAPAVREIVTKYFEGEEK